MLNCLVAGGDRYCDQLSRRELLRIGGLGLGGLSLVSLLGQKMPKAAVAGRSSAALLAAAERSLGSHQLVSA